MQTNSTALSGVVRKNPLRELVDYGQSVWLDYIRRSLITSGELQRLVDEDGLMGVTSNPAIFEKAITASDDYTVVIQELARRGHSDPKEVFEALAILDVQAAANVFRPVYQRTRCRDGYVSLEVSPHLAHDTSATIDEARRLWRWLSRPNAMIKVPATPEGVDAFRELIGEGINVNVTLLFSTDVYERVADAYMSGLEELVRGGGNLERVASVASFFISRIDTAIDADLIARLAHATTASERTLLASLRGRVAIANARVTYERYGQIFGSHRWRKLSRQGAQTQRLLWASTGTNNPAYRDVIYVEELIGADTVNTIPPSTFDAFRDHGELGWGLVSNLEGSHQTMQALATAGISLNAVTDRLLDEGLQLFIDAFDSLLATIDCRCQAAVAPAKRKLELSVPDVVEADMKAVLDDWRSNDKVHRLWAGDASLWTGKEEGRWLGWLNVTQEQLSNLRHVTQLSESVKTEGFTHVLLLGMGGSSLCPEVLARSFGRQPGFPEFHVLDATDPAQVKAFEHKVDLAKTLFVVSSKSGSTLEPNIFREYFLARAREAVQTPAADRFIAITDPGSSLQQAAEHDGFRQVFPGVPEIGGRYSALSNFGMVPAAMIGVDVTRFLSRTQEMVRACSSGVAEHNPGVVLGALLGVCARHGRDKVTLICSPGVSDLSAWLEQLLAESTGKEGRGLIPVDREALGAPGVYGRDRVFIYIRLASGPDASQDAAIASLERAGHPVARITLSDVYDLGQEFFRWELATAVAGSVLGINSFDQPDVEASKLATRRLTAEYERTGELPVETPFFEHDGIRLFADSANEASLRTPAGSDESLVGFLRAHLARINAGDYFALLAYVDRNDRYDAFLQDIRHAVRDKRRVATCLGFGPRFLHSTGQAYKGGPNTGVFLQVTCDDTEDVAVPGQRYTFGIVKAAQARGDFQVLAERGRRALRVHLGTDVCAGLATLSDAVARALR